MEIDVKKIRLLGDRVLVKITKNKDFGGIIVMPESNKEKATQGEILGVGDGVVGEKTHKINVQIGDRVIFQKWANGQEINEDHLVLKYSDICAVVEG